MGRSLGIGVLAAGIMLAVGAAAKLPPPGETFSDTMPLFVLGLLMTLSGGAVWRRAERLGAVAAGAGGCGIGFDPLTSIGALPELLNQAVADAPSQTDEQRRAVIDAVGEKILNPLGGSHAALREQLGAQEAAALLMEAAACERLLNRAWSASADGNAQESLGALRDAAAASEAAASRLAAGNSQ